MKQNGSGGGRRTYSENTKRTKPASDKKQTAGKAASSPSARNGRGGRRVIQDAAARKVSRRRKGLLIALICILLVLLAACVALKLWVRAPEVPSHGGGDKTGQTGTVDSTKPPVTDVPDGNISLDDPTDLDEEDSEGPQRISEHVYTFLVCGTDVVADNTDTIMVVRYDVDNQNVNVVSIPRDTMINVSWSVKKINAAYSNGGIDQLKSEIKKLLGFSIDYYVLFDKEAVVKYVDTIGGVDFEVPRNMVYDDPDQNLHINISAGWHRLYGEDAYKVLRYRQGNNDTGYADGDIGRINTQQALLKTIMKQTLQITNLTKIDQFADLFIEYVETDLALGEIVWLAQQALNLDMANVSFMTIPGEYNDYMKGLSYVTVNVDELLTMVNTCLNPYDTPVTVSNVDILTKDANRNIYATTGTIRGGVESFGDFRVTTPTTPDPGTGGETGTETPDPGTGGETGTETPDPGTGGETGTETPDPGTGGETTAPEAGDDTSTTGDGVAPAA